jgi:hypothetical protein
VQTISEDPEIAYPSLHLTVYFDPELIEASDGVMVACSTLGLGHCLRQVGLPESFPLVHVISDEPEIVYPSLHLTVYFAPLLIEASDGVMVAYSMVGLEHCWMHVGCVESFPSVQVISEGPEIM